MATTVIEIGKLAGCSGATVSRVINNRGYVNPEMRDAVLNVLNRVNYPRSRTGRRGRPPGSVKTPAVNLIELLYFRDRPIERMSVRGGAVEIEANVPSSGEEIFSESYGLCGSFYRRIIDGVVGELGRWGMKGVVEFTESLATPSAITRVNKPDRAGVLLMGEYSPDLAHFVQSCVHPIVLVDIIENVPSDVVTTDNHAGMGEAFDHLYALGHRSIGYVGRRETSAGFRERFAAFKLKMVETGLPVRNEWIGADFPCRIDEAEIAATRILLRADRPTALMCGNDVDALGVYRAASALGVRIPDQLSIVGFDDHESASLVTPALTTVKAPTIEMGAQAVRQLILQIRQPKQSPCRVRLVPKLIVRGSTRQVAP